MVFPWPVISRAALASGHIVEDLKLGVDLALAGAPTLFCPEARVTSYFPAAADGISSQRTRWEHGHLEMICRVAPRLLLEALRRRDRDLFALALDLFVPPLALLSLTTLTVFACGMGFYLVTKLILPLWLSAVALLMLTSSVLISWGRYGRRVISLAVLACAPFYALWKIPLYLKFLVKRQAAWVRTKRND
jgi:cellulose synthase/poly-beta-1,6-N-acetylglucosamine synthase-like glycosyltransferase